MSSNTAQPQSLSQRYYDALLLGDRMNCRRLIETAIAEGVTAYQLLNDLIWPTMELLQALYRDDRVSVTQLNLATRLNRSITDQLTAQLTRKPANGKNVLIICGDDE